MTMLAVETSKIINAPAPAIHAVIADYHGGHQEILPRPYFTEMIVKEGGYGAGTRLTVKMNFFGMKYTYNQIVTEPEIGRIIKDTDINTGEGATFILDPLDDGQRTKVSIIIDMEIGSGIGAMMKKLTTPPLIRFIMNKELDNLAEVVAKQEASASTTA